MTIRDRIRNLRDETGKFSKGDAYYVNNAYFKPFRCGNCFHFRNGSCNIVSSEGDPNPGTISAEGSCALFNARGPRIQAIQMLWGRADLDGLAPETIRATAFMFTYSQLEEKPPEDLLEKALISPQDIPNIY